MGCLSRDRCPGGSALAGQPGVLVVRAGPAQPLPKVRGLPVERAGPFGLLVDPGAREALESGRGDTGLPGGDPHGVRGLVDLAGRIRLFAELEAAGPAHESPPFPDRCPQGGESVAGEDEASFGFNWVAVLEGQQTVAVVGEDGARAVADVL